MRTGKSIKQHPIDGSYDVIIIGSGMGALTTAALMAKEAGKRVLLLERHYTAGGFTHSFKRSGYEWDVGIHYMGEMTNRDGVGHILDYISEGGIQWASLGDVYDQIVIGDDRYDFVVGRRNFRDKLCGYFPGEVAAIDGYMAELKKLDFASKLYFGDKVLPRPLSSTIGRAMRRPMIKMSRRTVHDVLTKLTGNQRLRAVLAGQWGDYGLPPKQASFAIQSMVAQHYFRGAYYPVGGASVIAAAIEPIIERSGGRIATNAPVEQIVIERGRAVGVRLENGQEVRAPIVISNAGAPLTERLLPREAAAKSQLADAMKNVQPSGGHVSLYIGLEHTAEELGLPKNNMWVYPGDDHDAQADRFARDPDAELPVAFISFPSARDPEFTTNYPGRATIEVITMAQYDWFAKWEDSRWKKRGADYEAFKTSLEERLLEKLYEQVPQVKGKVAVCEVSTPLSTKHFSSHPKGEIYGLACTPERFAESRLRPGTRIPGLWMTGADVVSPGVAGAAIGGLLTTMAIMKRNIFGRILKSKYEPRIVSDDWKPSVVESPAPMQSEARQ